MNNNRISESFNHRVLQKSEFFKSSLTLITGTVLAKFIGFLLMPILARLYSKEAFGLFTSFSAMVSLISSYATLKYDTAIVLPEEEKEAYALLKLSFYISALLICVSCLVLCIPIPYFKEYNHLQFLIALGAGFSINCNISELWNIRKKEFRITTKAKIIQSLGIFLFQLAFYFIYKDKVTGLIIGNICGFVLSGLYLIIIRRRLVQKSIRNSITREDLKSAANRYKDFPKYFVWSNIILNLSSNLPVLLFAKSIPLDLLGLYGVALRIVDQPVSLISTNVQSIIMSYMPERKKAQMPILKWYLRITLFLFMISLAGCFIIIWKGEELASFFLGKEWAQAGTIIKSMLPMLIGSMIASPATASVRVFEMQKYTLFYSILSFSIKLISLILLLYFNIKFELLIFIYSTISLLIILYNNIIIIKKIIKYEKNIYSKINNKESISI